MLRFLWQITRAQFRSEVRFFLIMTYFIIALTIGFRM